MRSGLGSSGRNERGKGSQFLASFESESDSKRETPSKVRHGETDRDAKGFNRHKNDLVFVHETPKFLQKLLGQGSEPTPATWGVSVSSADRRSLDEPTGRPASNIRQGKGFLDDDGDHASGDGPAIANLDELVKELGEDSTSRLQIDTETGHVQVVSTEGQTHMNSSVTASSQRSTVTQASEPRLGEKRAVESSHSTQDSSKKLQSSSVGDGNHQDRVSLASSNAALGHLTSLDDADEALRVARLLEQSEKRIAAERGLDEVNGQQVEDAASLSNAISSNQLAEDSAKGKKKAPQSSLKKVRANEARNRAMLSFGDDEE